MEPPVLDYERPEPPRPLFPPPLLGAFSLVLGALAWIGLLVRLFFQPHLSSAVSVVIAFSAACSAPICAIILGLSGVRRGGRDRMLGFVGILLAITFYAMFGLFR